MAKSRQRTMLEMEKPETDWESGEEGLETILRWEDDGGRLNVGNPIDRPDSNAVARELTDE
jgi:hypothetical protein